MAILLVMESWKYWEQYRNVAEGPKVQLILSGKDYTLKVVGLYQITLQLRTSSFINYSPQLLFCILQPYTTATRRDTP